MPEGGVTEMNVDEAADAMHDAAIAGMRPGETPETRERDALYGTGHDPSPVEVPSPYLAQYRAELEGRKKTLEADLRTVKTEINSVGDMVLEDFAERGATSMKLVTGETVFMHTQPRASVKAGDWERLADEATVAFCDQAGDAASMALRELHSACSSPASTSTPSRPGVTNASPRSMGPPRA